MQHETLAHKRIRKDLLIIFVLVVVIVAAMVALAVVDAKQSLLSGWSEAFYNFILRR